MTGVIERNYWMLSIKRRLNFRSQDEEEYIWQLKITLDEVKMSIDDFKKLYNKMKNESK